MKRQYCGQYCFFNRYNLSLIVYEDTLCGLLKNFIEYFIIPDSNYLFIYRIMIRWAEYRKFRPYFSINIVKRYASTINKQNYTHLLIAAHYYTQNLFETSERDWHFVYRLNNILLNSPPEKKKKRKKERKTKETLNSNHIQFQIPRDRTSRRFQSAVQFPRYIKKRTHRWKKKRERSQGKTSQRSTCTSPLPSPQPDVELTRGIFYLKAAN